MWKELQDALTLLGFSDGDREDIASILAAVLHIGNVELVDDPSSDRVQLTESKVIVLSLKLSHLFSICDTYATYCT
jgi:myosin heavy subunit